MLRIRWLYNDWKPLAQTLHFSLSLSGDLAKVVVESSLHTMSCLEDLFYLILLLKILLKLVYVEGGRGTVYDVCVWDRRRG